MVTPTSFMHIRSTLGLALYVRQLAKLLRRTLKKVDLFQEEERKAEKAKDVETVKEKWKDLLAAIAEEEEELKRITQNEERIIYDEEENEKKEEQKLQKILDELEDEDKRKLQEFFDALRETVNEMHQYSEQIREEERDMYLARERFLKYLSFGSDYRTVRVIRRLARKDYRYVKVLEEEQTKINELLDALQNCVAGNKAQNLKAIKDLIKKITADEDTLKDDLTKELETTKEIMHDINTLQFHLLNKLMKEDEQDFERLLKEGFPPTVLEEIRAGHRALVESVHITLKRLYRMATLNQQISQ